MRSKENAQDYRYFPDPDLLPIILSDTKIARIKKIIPEMPAQKVLRFMDALGLNENDALFLTGEKELADYFEKTSEGSGQAKASANWIMTDLMRELNASNLKISESPIAPDRLSALILMIEKKLISGKIAKNLFIEMWKSPKFPDVIAQEQNLMQISDNSAIEKVVQEILDQNPTQVAEYKAGKTKVMGFFVGLIMKASRGQANPDLVNQILVEKLKG